MSIVALARWLGSSPLSKTRHAWTSSGQCYGRRGAAATSIPQACFLRFLALLFAPQQVLALGRRPQERPGLVGLLCSLSASPDPQLWDACLCTQAAQGLTLRSAAIICLRATVVDIRADKVSTQAQYSTATSRLSLGLAADFTMHVYAVMDLQAVPLYSKHAGM